jgi:cation:H+ antiporter
MLYELGSLFGGLLLLVYGSDRTVASASAFAHALGVSTLFIGITIVAVGSSLPEIATSIYGSVYDTGDFVVAHIVGSATSQITLGIGILALTASLSFERRTVYRYGTGMVAAMAIMLVGVWGGRISRLLGAVMVVLYAFFLLFRFEHDGYQQSVESRVESDRSVPRLIVQFVVGIAMVIVGGHLLITGARGVAVELGVPWYLLGVVTGLGTTIPEIAIGASSIYHDEESIAIGTLLGSNITDPLFSLGIGAAVGTIVIDDPQVAVVGTAYMLAASAIVLLLAYWRETFGRAEGILCVLLYLPTYLVG